MNAERRRFYQDLSAFIRVYPRLIFFSLVFSSLPNFSPAKNAKRHEKFYLILQVYGLIRKRLERKLAKQFV